MFLAGCAAFALFFIGDVNDMRPRGRIFAAVYPAGFLLLAASIALQCRGAPAGAGKTAGWVLFVLFFALEAHSLFFAVPAGASYSAPGKKRPVCDRGVYALCRHPGVLFFAPMAASLCIAEGFPPAAAAAYTALDVLLVAFEDRRVFPLIIDGYEEYRRVTPFLVPTAASLKRCFGRAL